MAKPNARAVLIVFGAVLVGVGVQRLVTVGTCSSTGFTTQFGPAPRCPGGLGWDVAMILAGFLIATVAAASLLGAAAPVPGFIAIGVGSLLAVDAEERGFTIWFGIMFVLLGVVYAGLIYWVRWSDARYEERSRRGRRG